jgi:hypothetical protein
MLCTACETSTECSLIGQDLCLNYGDGKQFCARDCRTVSCPAGYTCEDVTLGGNNYRQCIPLSGACDCGTANAGVTEACELTTPFGACGGTRTCGGATGWDACLPPAPTDTPDGTFSDDDCDGIDGDLDGGIFVSVSGQDVAGCGTDYAGLAQPYCRSISFGIGQAFFAGFSYVYVQAGNYDEVVVLYPGIHVFGGYDDTWRRDGRGQGGHTVTVTGRLDPGTGQFMTVRAHDLNVPTTVADLVLVGPVATGVITDGSGHSSYVVHVSNSAGLTLERVTIQAGTGAPGLAGGAGLDAANVSATAGMNGGLGGAANESTESCNDSSRGAGGTRGTNSCSGLSANGGAGGAGGTMDTRCEFLNWNYNATAGIAGNNADQNTTSGYGYRGAGGYAGNGDYTSGPGGPGNAGRVQNGLGGTAGSGAYLIGLYWYARSGGGGGAGQTGGGGGGGGGSGGSDWGIDSWGAGGGGGGAGGCAAQTGGGGGGGGGGSFGVFAANSTVAVTDCVVIRGQGGGGGAGGTGGRGQSPGAGGGGGAANGDSAAGGGGGRGGHGGHGGGGGGGAGGSTYAFFTFNGTVNQTCTISSGGGGAGGTAGVSAPGAPAGENDGNPGSNGSGGGFGDLGACSSVNSCQ